MSLLYPFVSLVLQLERLEVGLVAMSLLYPFVSLVLQLERLEVGCYEA